MIDVDKALSRGYILLVIIPALLFAPSAIAFWYFFYIHPGISLILGIGVSWIWWSIICPMWKIWAFQRVKNKNALYYQAIARKLIWPKGSIFNFSEIKTLSQQKRINDLLKNIEYSNYDLNELEIEHLHEEEILEKGLIKNHATLIGSALIFLLALLLNLPSEKTNFSSLESFEAILSNKPELKGKKSDRYIQLQFENYKKTFRIQGFVYDAMCTSEFIKNASVGTKLKVFIKAEDFEDVGKEARINNFNSVYQLKINQQEYVSLELMYALKKADQKITKYIFIISLILLLYSFINKPKVSIWIPILITISLAIYLSFMDKKASYEEFGFNKKCRELNLK